MILVSSAVSPPYREKKKSPEKQKHWEKHIRQRKVSSKVIIGILQCGYVARSQDQTYKVLTIVVSHSGRFKKPTGLLSSWRNYWKWWLWCGLCWILQTNWRICKSVVYLHKQTTLIASAFWYLLQHFVPWGLDQVYHLQWSNFYLSILRKELPSFEENFWTWVQSLIGVIRWDQSLLIDLCVNTNEKYDAFIMVYLCLITYFG